ncbi:NB-ARC domain-containing protein [Actinocrispum sp. NPDC049592]|uniref:NB-ARC domain-containing protein n=1 Tax=Actinocrispum sp. NPDC049592 TaxID=3154835 RepID=UPI0034343CCB
MTEPAGFGAELRRLRLQAGISLSGLARRVPYSKGYLSKVETGLAQPNMTLAHICDNELGTGGQLATLVPVIRRGPGRPRVLEQGLAGLPPVTEHFIGRTGELTQVLDAFSRPARAAPVCVLDGMAGVGKTALAVRAAYQLSGHFCDGTLFLDLRGYAPDAKEVSAGEALHRILRLLRVGAEDIPGHLEDVAALYRDRLRGRRILIVLDNVRSAGQVVPLLPAEPGCGVLVTSRNRLTALDDARHVSVGVLPQPEAARLFRSVAGTRLAGERPQTHQPVGRIVQRCGRLPLAIRIAAARYRGHPAWTVAGFDRRLADEEARLAELDDGERSVSAAFHLSYRDLPPDQRRMFALLALHKGPDIDLPGAAALAGTGLRQTERLLDRLHDANLIIQHAYGRYRFHDLVQAFAAEHAVLPEPEQDAAVRRLLDHALGGAEAADVFLAPHRYRPEFGLPGRDGFTDRAAAMEWMDQEWPNLVSLCRISVVYKVHTRCWQLAYSLRGFFYLTKLWQPWVETHALAVEAARTSGDKWAEATTLNSLGIAHIDQGDQERAAECYRAALSLFEAIGDRYGTNNCLVNLAWVHHYCGNFAASLRDMWRALTFYQTQGSSSNAAITLRGIAVMQIDAGATTHAIRHLKQVLAEFRRLDMPLDEVMALNCLGLAYLKEGCMSLAEAYYHQAVELGEACGARYEAARAEVGLSEVAAACGRPEDVQAHLARAGRWHPRFADARATS